MPIIKKPLVVLSGCSGGGKSTLLTELAQRGYTTFEEPGREIVRSEVRTGGTALPHINPEAFAMRCIEKAIEYFEDAPLDQWSFCDRSVIDALSSLEYIGCMSPQRSDIAHAHRYAGIVFMTPPWPEIFETDAERTHGFEEAVAEYRRLCNSYPAYGYQTLLVPKAPVPERADFVLAALSDR